MNTNTQTPITTTGPSSSASIAGGVLSILSLILSGIGSLLIHAKPTTTQSAKDTAEKAGETIANGTAHVVGAVLGMPFLVGGITLALLAILFTVLRLTKIRVGGLIISIIWILLSVWSLQIAIAAFSLIKARSA